MKTMFEKIQRSIQIFTGIPTLCLILLTGPHAPANESYELILDNFEQTSENEIRLDVMLHNTGTPFFLNDVQVEITFNANIMPPETFFHDHGLQILPGSSDLLYPPENSNLTLAHDGERLILVSEKLYSDHQLQLINSDQVIRIARLQIFLYYAEKRGAFLNVKPNFNIDPYASKVQKANVDEFNYKEGFGQVLGGRQLVNNSSDRPLASHYFTGNGSWYAKEDDQYIHWNDHPETHSDFANQLPGKHADVIIGGNVVIKSGDFVELLSNATANGGSLTLVTAEEPMYRIELLDNGDNVSLLLVDENFDELQNPSFVYAGSIVYFGTYCLDEFGEFLNWKDQHGNIVSTDPEHGPYIMPAEDMVITANWSSGDPANAAPAATGCPDKMLQGAAQPDRTSKGNSRDEMYSDLIIEPGGSLTAETLYNIHEAGPAAIVLQSNTGNDAPGSLIHHNEGVQATVERTINRWHPNTPNHGWHMISSPVQQMNIRPEFVPDGPIPPWIDFYKWDEAQVQNFHEETVTGWWINSKTTGGAWNNDFENEFVTGRGYLLAYGQPEKDYGDKTHRFAGTLETATVPVNGLTHSSMGEYAGWHLLGNPFASAIDWSKGDWQRTNIIGGPKIWDEPNASYTPVIDIIPAMSGFMVHTSGNGSLTIPPTARVHHPAGWYKSPAKNNTTPGNTSAPPPTAKQKDGQAQHIRLVAHDPAGQTAQETIILFRPDASEGADPLLDTPFMAGYAPLFFSLTPAILPASVKQPVKKNPKEGYAPLALNNLPAPREGTTIPLGFVKNGSSLFHIELARTVTGVHLFLEDLITKTMHPLSDDPLYPFTATETDPPLRFRLHLTAGEPPLAGIDEYNKPVNVFSYGKRLHVHSTCEHTTLQVFDVQGQVMMEQSLWGQGKHEIHPRLPTGIYLVRTNCDETVATTRVFVQ